MQIFFRKAILAILSLSMIILPFIGPVFRGGEDAYFEKWSKDDEFTRDYCVEVEKDPDRDFVILNFTDIQLFDNGLEEDGKLVKRCMDKMVRELKPDLITLTGDNSVTTFSYIQTIRWIDSYRIPWAPLMGNHDGEGCPSEFWCAYDFTLAKHCLFKFGPEDMGYGNYIVNVTENGEIIHSIFLMDTHNLIEEDNINGKAGSGYDHLWANQLEWYSWAIDGIERVAGHTVESTVMTHIPVYEYKDAWDAATGGADWEADNDAPFIGEYAETASGKRHEYGGWAPQSNGFFDLMKQKGSTKNMVCGHDHVCDFSIPYEGIRLTYAVKTGPGGYWEPEMNGGTTVTIDSAGSATVAQHYYDLYEG